MTKTKFLRQAIALTYVIAAYESELRELRESSPKRSRRPTEKQAVSLADLERRIESARMQKVRALAQIHEAIDGVSNPDLQLVLLYRYIQTDRGRRLTWADIAGRMNYSETQVRRLHRRALDEIVIPEAPEP